MLWFVEVCSGGSRPVPWGVITTSPSNYLERGSVPPAFVVKDPSHMKTDEVNCMEALGTTFGRQKEAGHFYQSQG